MARTRRQQPADGADEQHSAAKDALGAAQALAREMLDVARSDARCGEVMSKARAAVEHGSKLALEFEFGAQSRIVLSVKDGRGNRVALASVQVITPSAPMH
ncbi:MAG: hypothetical protein IPG63_15365 [Xanthomonadales bacterium]|nr:hypothetical protein [Xanthomonadales bacterium]MCC7247739.1 hypothetical protein [Lysobacter sp.]